MSISIASQCSLHISGSESVRDGGNLSHCAWHKGGAGLKLTCPSNWCRWPKYYFNISLSIVYSLSSLRILTGTRRCDWEHFPSSISWTWCAIYPLYHSYMEREWAIERGSPRQTGFSDENATSFSSFCRSVVVPKAGTVCRKCMKFWQLSFMPFVPTVKVQSSCVNLECMWSYNLESISPAGIPVQGETLKVRICNFIHNIATKGTSPEFQVRTKDSTAMKHWNLLNVCTVWTYHSNLDTTSWNCKFIPIHDVHAYFQVRKDYNVNGYKETMFTNLHLHGSATKPGQVSTYTDTQNHFCWSARAYRVWLCSLVQLIEDRVLKFEISLKD